MISILIPCYDFNAYPLVNILEKQALILNINFDGELKMTVFNMLGQQLLETNNKQIDISGFDQGTYILIVQNLESNNSTNFKIIKE